MIKKSFIWLYSIATWLLWAGVIVVASIVLSLRYFILPNIQQYKATIEQHASEAAGQKISIGGIQASWDGMHPHLDLSQVVLHDNRDRPALTLDHIETSLSWLSLPLGEIRLSSLVFHQPQLTVRRENDGTVYVAGIAMSGPARPEFPNWLLRQSSIEVIDASVLWQDELRKAPPLTMQHLSMQLSSPAWGSLLGRHRFGLRATPSAGASLPIDIRGNLLGKDVAHPEQWRGTIYARVEGTNIAAWRAWIDFPYDLSQGHGATQMWVDFSAGKADKVVADVVLANVVTQFGAKAQETSLDQLSGRLTWSRKSDGQELHAERLRLASAGLKMKDGEARVRSRLINGKERVEGSVRLDEIGLEQLAAFASNLPFGEETKQMLALIAPRGQLQGFEFDWNGEPSAVQTFELSSRFTNLAVSPYQGLPGFAGLSGELEATQDSGELTLNSTKATLDLKDILRQPIPADKLNGHASWKKRNGQLEVDVTNLAIASPHLAGTINASYQRGGQGAGVLDLTGKFDQVDGRYASFYYPLVLSQGTLNWLDTSVLGGRGEDVNVIVKGNLDEFPWANKSNGLFQVSAKISNGVLDYASHWPRINDIKLNLLFRGNRMELNASQGRLYGNTITKAKVVIPILDAEHPVLEIKGDLLSPATDIVKYINTSPLLEFTNRVTENMQASGAGRLSLALQIPLDTDGVGTKLSGSYELSNGTLQILPDMATMENVNGRLDFTESTLRAENVQAFVLGSTVQFSVKNNEDGQLNVVAQGRIDDNGLRQLIAHPLADKLHGEANWTAEMKIINDSAEILFKSSLAGLAVALPPPFGKAADQDIPLLVEKRLVDDTHDQVDISYGNIASAKLWRTIRNGEMLLERAGISLGGNAQMPEQPGVSVSGRLEYLDWDQWQFLTEGHAPASDVNVSSADLSIGALDIFGRRINDLQLVARKISDGWVASLNSREISGDTTWQQGGNGKVIARLKTLIAPAPAPAKLSNPDSVAEKVKNYPALDIIADNFEYKQKKLGRLELIANQEGPNWNINKLVLSNPDSSLNLDGKWNNWRQRPATRLNINWDIKDLGKTLDRYGYADTIKGGSADLRGQLSWPNSPQEFDAAKLNGHLKLDALDGQFLKGKPGVGRLFGVLSLQNLPRRLLFDFSDVFDAGFSFDKVSGDVRIDNGIMQSKNFMMEGPAAKVELSGETDLAHETQNLHIKVTPFVSDSLSLAAFAGGPAVGAAALIAQKILNDPLNKLASYEYDITGTWDNPQEVKTSRKEPPAGTPPRPAPGQ